MEWTEDMFATEPVLEKIEALEQQLEEANDLLKRCEHKLVYYLSGEPAHELAEAIKEHTNKYK